MTTHQHEFHVSQLLAPSLQAAAEEIILSQPMEVNLSVYSGDSGSFRITVKDVDNNPIDISSATWDADIRVKKNDSTVVTNFEIEPVVGDTSSIDVILSAENSALLIKDCVYDIEMTFGGKVITLIGGDVNVTQDVSRSP